jgi:hypothetical protein
MAKELRAYDIIEHGRWIALLDEMGPFDVLDAAAGEVGSGITFTAAPRMRKWRVSSASP